MVKLLVTLFLISLLPTVQAASWSDSLKGMLGGEEEKTAEQVVEKVAEKPAANGSLTDMITSQLGVSKSQAQGGLGSLFGLAQGALGSSDFSKLSGLVPEMDTLLKAAPAVSKSLGGMNLPGDLNKYASAAGSAATAYSQFSELGLTTQDIPKYIDVTNQFFRSQGGKDAAELFMQSMQGLGE